MNNLVIAHELGHAVCAEVQDGFWYPTGLSFQKDESALAYCYCEKYDKRKPNLKGPHSKLKQMMNLGGIFGELLYCGNWNPWGSRSDIDEFITANSMGKHKLMLELNNWNWVDDDPLSFRACTKSPKDKDRRKFVLDSHNTARRLPHLWFAYLDFCDRINKKTFFQNIKNISSNNKIEIEEPEVKKIVKEILI